MGMEMGEELPQRCRGFSRGTMLGSAGGRCWIQLGDDVRFSRACKDPVRHKSEAADGDLAVVAAVSSLLQGESGHFFR